MHLALPEWDDRVRMFVQAKTGLMTPAGPTSVMGFLDEEETEIQAGWMFERYTGRGGSVYLHWAAGDNRRFLTRSALSLIAIYAYDQLGVDQVLGEVRASDTMVRRIDERLGFKEIAQIPGYFPNDDLVVYSLTKQECQWLPDEYKETHDGQEVIAS